MTYGQAEKLQTEPTPEADETPSYEQKIEDLKRKEKELDARIEDERHRDIKRREQHYIIDQFSNTVLYNLFGHSIDKGEIRKSEEIKDHVDGVMSYLKGIFF